MAQTRAAGQGAGSAAGQGTAAGTLARPIAAGQGAATGTTRALNALVGAAAGQGVAVGGSPFTNGGAAGQGSAIARTASVGTAWGQGTSQAVPAAVGRAAGQGSATGGSPVSIGRAAGQGSATAAPTPYGFTTGTAAGQGAATGGSPNAVGSAAGQGAAAGQGQYTGGATGTTGTAAGQGAATATSARLGVVTAAGTASGSGTAQATGQFGVPYGATGRASGSGLAAATGYATGAEPGAPAPLVVTLDQYLSLVTSEHQPQPRYMATVALSVRPFLDSQNSAYQIIGLYDLDWAVGQQLDFTGQWIGLSRFINIPINTWFSFDTLFLGFDEGRWQVPWEDFSKIVSLDDEAYRQLLKARVLANYWDGTIPGAYSAWAEAFADTGYQIVLSDQHERREPHVHGNMHIIQGLLGPPLTPLTLALFQGGYLGLKSAGVGVTYMTQSQPGSGYDGTSAPFFTFDTGGDPQSSWDQGQSAWDNGQSEWDYQSTGAVGNPQTSWDQGQSTWDGGASVWDEASAVFPPTTCAGFDGGAWGQALKPANPPTPLTTWDNDDTNWDGGASLWDQAVASISST